MLANTTVRTSTSKSIQRYQSSHAISSFAAIENAFTLWFAPSPFHRINDTHCIRALASETIPFVVVSKDETDVTARACETSRSRARGIELIKNCNYRAEIRKRALFRRWCKGHVNVIDRKSVIAVRPKRSVVVNEKRMHAHNSDTESAHYYFILRIDPSF